MSNIDRLANMLEREPGYMRVRRDELMSAHISFKVGGPADIFISPETPGQVARALSLAEECGVPVLIMGNGTNLIFRDGGYRGLVMRIGQDLAGVQPAHGDRLTALAGTKLSDLCSAAAEAGLSGLEFACGIPGTVGGAASMNAGAYGGDISGVFESAEVIVDGRTEVWSVGDMDYGYRTSEVFRRAAAVISATFALTPGDPDGIRARMDELNRMRGEKQPLDMPSAGSTFKRPSGHYTGALIDSCNLRGARVGGAQVSEKHAGFIVNAGGATAADILELIELVRATVKRRCGVDLELEVRVVGND